MIMDGNLVYNKGTRKHVLVCWDQKKGTKYLLLNRISVLRGWTKGY